jgi:hypothetical protein
VPLRVRARVRRTQGEGWGSRGSQNHLDERPPKGPRISRYSKRNRTRSALSERAA